MGFSWFLLLFIITLFFQLINPTFSANGNSDLIQQTCKNTKYYDLCVSSLKSDSSSLKADSKLGLALIMVRVGMANATATNSYISSQILSVKNDTAPMRKVMRECADKYGFANDALQNSVQDLSSELYDYAYMHVMAAADYPNACRNAFKRYPGLVYPQELAVREEGLKHICDVVLGIIDALGF
ncbi:UNVERIFIED_CONTAM: Cell wall / vacuolar inhibitor of fructosidase 2 [Sesamum latifolium]|uniref:Cell wall / vacuolar inhibitor of fructosidase 2 n=1 Tax=Sesamum latifolium TaxID=2727402 RepID=A0AAW2XAL2_9LAMI